MRLFTSTAIDPRKLSMLAHQIARMHPGRREYIYGKVLPMEQPKTGLLKRLF